MDEVFHELSNKLRQELTLDTNAKNKDDLIFHIKRRVEELLQNEPGLLFSYLYRLDVSEHKVRMTMNQSEKDKIDALTQLIYERQLLRVETKKRLKQKPIKGWDW